MYNGKLKEAEVEGLLKAVFTLESIEEAHRFFEDICSVSELKSISQRFEVARMLRDGSTYAAIAEKTGASTATISRVNRSLLYGSNGYEIVFERLDKANQ